MKNRIKAVKRMLRKRFPELWWIGIYYWWRARLSSPLSETKIFRQMRRINETNRGTRATSGSARDVLFFASRQDRDQLAMVTTLAWSLQRRGHRPFVVGCDRALDHSCNSGFYPRLNPWLCRLCHHYAAHTHSLTGIP